VIEIITILNKGTTAALFIENTMLQTQLRKLSKSLREVYKNEAVDSHEQEISQLKKENQELLELLNISKLSYQQEASSVENSSPVLQVVKTGVVEEFFNE
jgi:cell shape-determining protein MreC